MSHNGEGILLGVIAIASRPGPMDPSGIVCHA